jgi:23S rRNA (pseudouridine1915-N3)-methyltransferase
MKILLQPVWAASEKKIGRAFKSKYTYGLVTDYVQRISRFAPCALSPFQGFQRKPDTTLWVCDRGPGSKMLSSEEVASLLEELLSLGQKELTILIGGADGFSKEALDEIKPHLRWSFGPVTLSHELACVVAAEQIYRAWTILRNMPYHCKH